MDKAVRAAKKTGFILFIGYILHLADNYFALGKGLFVNLLLSGAYVISALAICYLESDIIRRPRKLNLNFVAGAGMAWRESAFIRVFRKNLLMLLIAISSFTAAYFLFSRNFNASVIQLFLNSGFFLVIYFGVLLLVKLKCYPLSERKTVAGPGANPWVFRQAPYYMAFTSVLAGLLSQWLPPSLKPFFKRKLLYLFREQFLNFFMQYLLLITAVCYVILQRSYFFTYLVTLMSAGYLLILLGQISVTELKHCRQCPGFSAPFFRIYFSELIFFTIAAAPFMLLFILGNSLLSGRAFLRSYFFYENLLAFFILIYLGLDDFLMEHSTESRRVIKMAGYLLILWAMNLFEIKGLMAFSAVALWFFYDFIGRIARPENVNIEFAGIVRD